jgi:hypothetical protein
MKISSFIMKNNFDREEHVYRSNAFEEIIKDTVRFFNGTPVVSLPPSEKFRGPGVYCLYYIGNSDIYKQVSDLNRIEFAKPIYVGKAVPKGWRTSRNKGQDSSKNSELCSRLRKHSRGIVLSKNLEISDFKCRFMILEGEQCDLIGTVEAALIRYYTPIWNTVIEGFGNNDPGNGRYNQAVSDWDVMHPGRKWVKKLTNPGRSKEVIESKIQKYFK